MVPQYKGEEKAKIEPHGFISCHSKSNVNTLESHKHPECSISHW